MLITRGCRVLVSAGLSVILLTAFCGRLTQPTAFAEPGVGQGRTDEPSVSLPEPAVPGLRYYYPPQKVEPRRTEVDVCVYGGTSGGVIAAVQAARMGKKAVLLVFGKHIGGLSSGGLSHTDGGDPSVCGGVAREFYKLIGQRNFRPSEAEAAFEKLLNEAGVHVHRLCHLDDVRKEGTRIVSIKMENGLEVRAEQFIDATYEGDLLARAGVSWTAGREANSVYGETYNGIRTPGRGGHNWPASVDPYRTPGEPESGLLPRVNSNPGTPGEGDHRIQAFCFRMWLTKDNPLPFPRPAVYEPDQYELLARLFESGADPKTRWSLDTNNHHLFNGAYFIDFVGGNYDWPNADWAERERLFQAHANYQIGVMWFLTHSDRVPDKYQAEFRKWGLPRDEYEGTGGWTHQLYIREGRRMVSDYVMTQHNCQGRKVPEDSVGLASYNMDSHHCQMTVVAGAVRNEGNVEIPVEPYPISYRAVTPKRQECTNLLVPVAVSSSHIAFGSIRMEPVFMLLGQSAATAACLAIDESAPVQELEYAELRKQLLDDGQILEYTGPPRHKHQSGSSGTVLDPETLPGIVRDNDAAELSGPWQTNDVTHPRVGPTYLHDGNSAKGKCMARYVAKLPEPGRYEVRLSWPVNPNRATNVPVTVHSADGVTKTIVINQKKAHPDEAAFTSLGVFDFGPRATVEISNAGTNGYVIADAVQFVTPGKKQPGDDGAESQASVNPLLNGRVPAAPDAPNILVILADDLGYETLDCYGGLDFSTPHLDRLADEGVRCTRAYTSPVCTPSRMSFYTGQYTVNHDYGRVLPVHVGSRKAVDFSVRPTIAQALRQAGYATAVTGKWQLAALEFHPEHIRIAGFDSWCVWQIWRDGAKTTRFWDPCFNHDGRIRDDISERFGPDVLADYVIDRMTESVEAGRPFYIHHNMLLPHWPIIKTPHEKSSGKPASLEGMIAYMDQLVARLVSAVEELEIEDNTWVVFIGDNGTDSDQSRETTDGFVRGGKHDLVDAGMHVPFLIRGPQVKPGTEFDDLIDMADVFSTLCDLAGVKLPASLQLDGISFAPQLLGQSEKPARTFITAGLKGDDCVFDGAWRLHRRNGALYDCRQLPEETRAFPDAPGATAARQRLSRLLEQVKSE